MITWNKSD